MRFEYVMRWLPTSILGIAFAACGGAAISTSQGTGSTSTDDGGPTSADTMSTSRESETSSSSSSTSVGESSTGTDAVCGDGEVGSGEECDDGNVDDGDACLADCTLPYVVAWTATHDGGDGLADTAMDVAIGGDGTIYVVGMNRSQATGEDVWLQTYAADGTEGWSFSYDGPDSLDDRGNALALLENGDVVVVGISEASTTASDMLVMRIAGDGSSSPWQQTRDGTGTGGEDNDVATAVAVTAQGLLVVVGSEGVAGQDGNILVAGYDADGNEVWVDAHDGPMSDEDRAEDVVIDANGDIWVLGRQGLGMGIWDPWIASYDEAGTELGSQVLDDVGGDVFNFIPEGLAVVEGGLVATGGSVPGDTSFDGWTVRYSTDLTSTWAVGHDGPAHAVDRFRGVAVDADGDLYLAGYEAVVGEAANVWVAKLRGADGSAVWSHGYNNRRASLDDVANAVAVASDGSVVVVGYETVLGQDRNAFVRKLSQN